MASNSEKDRLGEKLRDVERAREDQYFAERDRKLVEQMRREKAGGSEAPEGKAMRCPKCGTQLKAIPHHGASVDECPACHGVWLDRNELQQIAGREDDGWIARWLRREFRQNE